MTDYPVPKTCVYCATRGSVVRADEKSGWDFRCTKCGTESESSHRPLPAWIKPRAW